MRVNKQFIHIGPPYPQGRSYFLPSDWADAFRADPMAQMHRIYGFYRVDGPKVGAQVKAMTKGQLPEEEIYLETVAEAQKWLRDKARNFEATQGKSKYRK